MRDSVKVFNAALDVAQGPNGEDIILRGVVEPQSFGLVQAAEYQREILPESTLDDLVKALRSGKVPDITLGMRGDRVREEKGGTYFLQDPVFVIDGLQRLSAARKLVEIDPVATPRLGAVVYFSTSEAWEREQFRILNSRRVRLSSNILLRNLRHDFRVVEVLIGLTKTEGFPMKGRVCWDQRMHRAHLVTATTYMKVAGAIHRHLGGGLSTDAYQLSRGMQGLAERVGVNVVRDNVRTFWEVVDGCWGIQRVHYREGAVFLRAGFLLVLAELLSDHLNFWKGSRLQVDVDSRRKLAQFKLNDPMVTQLASTTGTGLEVLYNLYTKHFDSGKRSRRLIPRTHREPATGSIMGPDGAVLSAAAVVNGADSGEEPAGQ